MLDQTEQKLWDQILEKFDNYTKRLEHGSEISLEEMKELNIIQDDIVQSIESFFKTYGMSPDKTETIRSKYLESQQLFKAAREQLQGRVTDAINTSEAHKKYLNTEYR